MVIHFTDSESKARVKHFFIKSHTVTTGRLVLKIWQLLLTNHFTGRPTGTAVG